MYKMNKYVLFFVLVFFKQVRLENKLTMEVFFESLCPDSYKFIKEQLYPNFKDLSPYVNLKLVPFGKSTSLENGTKFTCHHGPPECKGNKILSCALNKLSDQSLQVEFTTCFMETFRLDRNNELEFGQKCAQTVGLDPNNIIECYNSEEGLIHQLKAEQTTKRISPKFVPTIVYNEQFDQKLHDDSLVNVKGVVCNLIRNSYPEACQEISPIIPL